MGSIAYTWVKNLESRNSTAPKTTKGQYERVPLEEVEAGDLIRDCDHLSIVTRRPTARPETEISQPGHECRIDTRWAGASASRLRLAECSGIGTVADSATFARDPVNIIRLFAVADETGLAIHPDAMRLVTLSLTKIDAAMRADPEANSLFVSILTSRNSPAVVLGLMNQAGVLGRFIPEFGRIVALMQFNMYHSYTVDEHLIRSIGILAEIESGASAIDHPLAQEVLPAIADRTVLYVALFLHDIAKGRTEDHSLAGVAVANKLCPRLGLDAAQTADVAWLIEQHLVMSDTAQRRDLSDRGTIESFAAIVGTIDRLNMLFVLTICDIRAVGPGVWNSWKGELLRTLYRETEHLISGEHSAVARERRVAAARDELRRALPKWSEHDFGAYAGRHQAPYWLKVDLAHKVRQLYARKIVCDFRPSIR